MNIGETAKLVLNIGQRAVFDGHEYEICDMGYRSQEGSFVPGSIGELHYHLLNAEKASIGWVLASSVTVPDLKVEQDSNDEFFDQDSRSPHLEELGYNMVSWLDGLENRPDNDTIPPVVSLLMAIQYHKEKDYGSSWKMRGEHRSIVPNIDRKFDRLSKMTDDEMSGKLKTLPEQESLLAKDYDLYSQEVGESKVDAVADLTNYGLLYMGYIRENFPNVFKVWVEKNVPKYLADKIPFLQTSTEE